tara:strand:+ start:5843 stop:6328 length:486 start_codon:yes stop_codon:yes gene_type:complete
MARSANISVKIEGDKQLIRALGSFKPTTQRKILRPAIAKAGRRLAKRAKQGAPADTKNLKKSIGSVVRTYGSNVVSVIGPRVKFDAWYAHLVERGTAPHVLREADPNTGRGAIVHPGSTANPFMAKAFQAMAGTTERQLYRDIQPEIEKQVKKHTKKALLG